MMERKVVSSGRGAGGSRLSFTKLMSIYVLLLVSTMNYFTIKLLTRYHSGEEEEELQHGLRKLSVKTTTNFVEEVPFSNPINNNKQNLIEKKKPKISISEEQDDNVVVSSRLQQKQKQEVVAATVPRTTTTKTATRRELTSHKKFTTTRKDQTTTTRKSLLDDDNKPTTKNDFEDESLNFPKAKAGNHVVVSGGKDSKQHASTEATNDTEDKKKKKPKHKRKDNSNRAKIITGKSSLSSENNKPEGKQQQQHQPQPHQHQPRQPNAKPLQKNDDREKEMGTEKKPKRDSSQRVKIITWKSLAFDNDKRKDKERQQEYQPQQQPKAKLQEKNDDNTRNPSKKQLQQEQQEQQEEKVKRARVPVTNKKDGSLLEAEDKKMANKKQSNQQLAAAKKSPSPKSDDDRRNPRNNLKQQMKPKKQLMTNQKDKQPNKKLQKKSKPTSKQQKPNDLKTAKEDLQQQQQGEQMKSVEHYIELSKKEGHDKERILYLLRDNANIPFLSDQTYEDLPSWSQVTALYGEKPIFVDQDQCQTFQSKGYLGDKLIGVAGAFNTGTNIMADALSQNCVLHKRQEKHGKKQLGIRTQVPYGKHVPPHDEEFRRNNIAKHSRGVDPRNVLPVVMVRDPFRWLQSMCLNYYTSRWPRMWRPTDPRYHCPNLFPTDAEKIKLSDKGFEPISELGNKSSFVLETPGFTHKNEGVFVDKQTRKERRNKNQATQNPEVFTANEPTTTLTEDELQMHYFPIKVGYNNFTQHHLSLVHYWQEWLQNYRQVKDYPHIFVRFEDLLYFPDEVVSQVCECAGGRLIHRNKTSGEALPVKLSSESQKQEHDSLVVAKGLLEHTGYLKALIRYANASTRFRGMTSHDIQYALRYLDAELMDLFHYSLPPAPKPQSNA